MLLRVLAILAATAPNFLSVLLRQEIGWFAYEPPQPDPLEVTLRTAYGYATDLLPVVLAILALWAPRWFPKAGATAAAVALALTAGVFGITGTGPFALQIGCILACLVIAIIALLRARPEQRVPRPQAIIWSAVVLLALAQTLTRRYAFDAPVLGCWAQIEGTWALAAMHLDTAHFHSYWLSVAAIGAVLAGYRGAPFFGLVLLVPALFHPVAWYLSGAGHTCSSTLALFAWPFLIAGVLALLSRVRLP